MGMSIAKSLWDFEKCRNVENSTGQMTHLLQHINCNLKEREHTVKETQNTESIAMFGPYLEPSLDKPTIKIYETVTRNRSPDWISDGIKKITIIYF